MKDNRWDKQDSDDSEYLQSDEDNCASPPLLISHEDLSCAVDSMGSSPPRFGEYIFVVVTWPELNRMTNVAMES